MKEYAAPEVPPENETVFICSRKTRASHFALPARSLDQPRGLLSPGVLQLL